MKDFDLAKFLQNYVPKKIDLKPYLKFKKLKGYEIMIDKKNLVPFDTHIKYIKTGDALENDEYSSRVIDDGGLLIAGGYFSGLKFVGTECKDDWKYLKLEAIVSKNTGKKQKKVYRYYIKIFNYHIFYKQIQEDDNTIKITLK